MVVDRQKDRQKDRKTERQKDRKTERQKDRQTDKVSYRGASLLKTRIYVIRGGKEETFTVLGGKNINYLDNIHPCQCDIGCDFVPDLNVFSVL